MIVFGLALTAICVLIVALPVGFLYWQDWRQDRQIEEEYMLGYKRYLHALKEHHLRETSRKAEYQVLIGLEWPKLRSKCEEKTGHPCECAAKNTAVRCILGPEAVRPLPPPRVL